MKLMDLKRGAAAVAMAGLMASFALPVSALAVQVGDEGQAKAEQTITKNWTLADGVSYTEEELNNMQFTFKMDFLKSDNVGKIPATDLTGFSKTLTMSGADAQNSEKNSKKLNEFFADVDFDSPGYYYFDLYEVPGADNNIKYDTTHYTVLVQVSWADPIAHTPKIESVLIETVNNNEQGEWQGWSTEGKTEAVTFHNDPVDVSSVTVEKKVAGTAANTADYFPFQVKLEGVSGSYSVTGDFDSTVTIDKKTYTNSTKIDGSKTYTFYLRHDQSIQINGLPQGATYTVTEPENGGYDSTDVVSNAVNSKEDGASADSKGRTASGTVNETADTVTFTNNKGFAPETGITMNVIPAIVAGGAAVAGAVTLVISRKRRAGEDF